MRRHKKAHTVLEDEKAILEAFIKKFNEKWGGFLVIDGIKQQVDDSGYLNIEMIGRYFPTSERGVCIHWKAHSHPYLHSRSRIPPYEITYLFYITSAPPLKLPLLLGAIFPRIRYSEVHKTPNPHLTLLKRITELFLTETVEDFVNLRQFLSQPNALETLAFLCYDLPRLAKGEYKGWYWRVVHRDLRTLHHGEDKLVFEYLLLFYKRGRLTITTQFAIYYFFKKSTFELKISFYADTYEIKEPFQNLASALLPVVTQIVEYEMPFPEELKQGATTERKVLFDVIEKLAHFVIDTILPTAEFGKVGEITGAPLSPTDENRQRLLKAISLLFSPTFLIAFLLNHGKQEVDGSRWSSGNRVMRIRGEPSSLLKVSFSLIKEKPQKDEKRVIKLKGEVSYASPSYRMVWEVAPSSGPTMTYTYPISKDILDLSRQEAKDLVLAFLRDCVSFLEETKG